MTSTRIGTSPNTQTHPWTVIWPIVVDPFARLVSPGVSRLPLGVESVIGVPARGAKNYKGVPLMGAPGNPKGSHMLAPGSKAFACTWATN